MSSVRQGDVTIRTYGATSDEALAEWWATAGNLVRDPAARCPIHVQVSVRENNASEAPPAPDGFAAPLADPGGTRNPAEAYVAEGKVWIWRRASTSFPSVRE